MAWKNLPDLSSLTRTVISAEFEKELLGLTKISSATRPFYTEEDLHRHKLTCRYPLPTRVPRDDFPADRVTSELLLDDRQWPIESIEYWCCVRVEAKRLAEKGSNFFVDKLWQRVAERLGTKRLGREIVYGVDQWYPSDPYYPPLGPDIDEIAPLGDCQPCSQQGRPREAMRGTTVCRGHLKWHNTQDRREIQAAWRRTANAITSAGVRLPDFPMTP